MKKDLLVVEDDPFTKQFYKFLFGKTKYNVIISEDGDEIIKLIESGKISLIIMDVNLRNTFLNNKKIDGLTLSRLIKKNPKFSNIPLLLVTAVQKKGPNRNFFEESLADDYIIKPIMDFNKLLTKIDNLILN